MMHLVAKFTNFAYQTNSKIERNDHTNIVIDWVPEKPIRSLAKWIYGKLELMFFFIFCQIYAKFENFSMLKLLNINQKKPKNMILSTPDPSLHIF